MHVRQPALRFRIKGASVESLSILSAVESFARAILSTVIPLQALALLGDAQRVSLFFFSISIVSLCGTLTVPWLIRHVRRRWIYSLGGCLVILSASLMAQGSLGGLVAQGFALAHAGRVDKLALISTVAGRTEAEQGLTSLLYVQAVLGVREPTLELVGLKVLLQL